MRNAFLRKVKQSSEELISEDLQLQSADFPFSSVFLNVFEEVRREEVHHNVQIFFISLVSEEGIADSKHIWVVETLQYLKFSVFVLFVLVHSLNGHQFQRFFVSGLMHDAKGSASYFILKGVSIGPNHAACFFALPLIALVKRVRIVLLGKDAIGSDALRMGELVLVLDFGVELGAIGRVLECDGLDRFLFLESECLVLVEDPPVLGKGSASLIDVEAYLLAVLVHVSLDASTGRGFLLDRRAHLQLQVSNHSLND